MTFWSLQDGKIAINIQFIVQMNQTIKGLYGYSDGMKVVSNDAGYWLEVNGEKQVGNEDLLSLARKIVLEAKS